MAPRLEFFFDVSSPWTWLAFERIVPLAAEAGVLIEWKPVLVGGVFNAVNQGIYEQRANPVPAKAAYAAKDLKDWARYQGLELHWPSVFPVRSVLAMRACVAALETGQLAGFARGLFEAYWSHGADISQPEVVAACAGRAGLEPAPLLEAASSEPVKASLTAITSELIARGGFGSPTIFVDTTDMYFGNDRMELVAAALRTALARHSAA
jgi:2-hydroxychromene-2-carboxylate isomerase